MQVNTIGAANLCIECAKRNIYFVHISSGCIYTGYPEKGYTEQDEPNFYEQFYAKTKIYAEKIIKEFPSLIIRLRMPVDNIVHDSNFITKVAKYKKVIHILNSMTVVPDMLYVLDDMIYRRITGIFNLVNPGLITAAEVMDLYKEIVDQNHNFEVIGLDELDKMVIATRSNCMLNTDKLKDNGYNLPDIKDAVISCMKQYVIEKNKK
jgi:dTDP-4-dehydrorhamnose reductase